MQVVLRHELVEKLPARGVVKMPETTGLLPGETQTGHFRKLAPNAGQ